MNFIFIIFPIDDSSYSNLSLNQIYCLANEQSFVSQIEVKSNEIFISIILIKSSHQMKYRAMEPAEKRAKLDEGEPLTTPPREIEFSGMNNDCILAILESLKLDYLYSLGSVSVRINQLAGDVFGRKHSDEWIDIRTTSNEHLFFDHRYINAEKYLLCIRVNTEYYCVEKGRIINFIGSKFQGIKKLEIVLQ